MALSPGHGPVMAIFELLDYIVNEVRLQEVIQSSIYCQPRKIMEGVAFCCLYYNIFF